MRTEELWGWSVDVAKGTELEEHPDGPISHDIWTLVFVEKNTGNLIKYPFRRDTRDELVRKLTGGIVLAGGELPNIGGPKV